MGLAGNNSRSYFLPAALILCVLSVTAGFTIWSRYQPVHPVEIVFSSSANISGTIYISGTVVNPGIYPFTGEDDIASLVKAAGGLTGGANLSSVTLSFIPQETSPQKIDINRAEPWLLEALPGIGPTLAQRIVEYRQQNSRFNTIFELKNVNGMGAKTFEQIQPLITVVE